MSDQQQRPHRRLWGAGAVAVVLVLMVAACGGGDDATDSTAELPQQEGPAPAGTSPDTAAAADSDGAGIADQAFGVDQVFWHGGFRVTVDGGEISTLEDQLTRNVTRFLTLALTAENLAEEEGFLDLPSAVTTDTNSYPASFASELPVVPGGLASQATLVYEIDNGFDLASARLIVGEGGDNQAQVPLAGTGDAVRLEPAELPLTGTLSMELIDLVVTGADLRYDVPSRHRQVEDGKRALTLFFDAVSRREGNWQIFDTDLALVLPSGTAIGPDGSEIGSLPGSAAGVTTPDRFVRFLVDEDAAGDYTLRLTPGDWFIGEDGVTEATLDFTIAP